MHTRKRQYLKLLENSSGFKRLAVSLKLSAKPHGVAIRLMYLTFKQDMMCPNVREDLQRSQIYNQFAQGVICLWEANTLSTNGVRKVNKIQNGFNFSKV